MKPDVLHLYKNGDTVRKYNISTAIILTNCNGGGGISDNGERRTSFLNRVNKCLLSTSSGKALL